MPEQESREDLIARLERAYIAPFEWEILLRAASAIHDLMAENAAQAALLREAQDIVLRMELASSPFEIDRLSQGLLAKLDAALGEPQA